MIQHCDKYLIYIILSLFLQFNAIIKLIHKFFTQVYYVSDIADCTVYECIKQYYNVAYQI